MTGQLDFILTAFFVYIKMRGEILIKIDKDLVGI